MARQINKAVNGNAVNKVNASVNEAALKRLAELEAQLASVQQAELERLRAAKQAEQKVEAPAPEVAPQVAAHAAAVQPEAAHVNVEDLMAGFELPSIKRVLVGAILGIAAAGAVGYGIGCVLAYAIAGIAVLTATAWIAFALSVLAWIVALYAGWKLGGYIGGKVFSSVVLPEGLASRSYASIVEAVTGAKQRAVGLFSVDKEELAAQVVAKFSGAHTVKAAA
jgi:hypothetical protein